MMMRTYWMMVAMVAAAAAACDESDGASGARAGTGAGGLHADSAGNAGAPRVADRPVTPGRLAASMWAEPTVATRTAALRLIQVPASRGHLLKVATRAPLVGNSAR